VSSVKGLLSVRLFPLVKIEGSEKQADLRVWFPAGTAVVCTVPVVISLTYISPSHAFAILHYIKN
jgi:hypothetical protein